MSLILNSVLMRGRGGRSEGEEGGDRFLRGSIKLRAGFGVNYFRSRRDCLTGAGLRLDVNSGNWILNFYSNIGNYFRSLARARLHLFNAFSLCIFEEGGRRMEGWMEGGWNEDGKRMVKVGKKDKCKRKSRIKEGVYSSSIQSMLLLLKWW